jgi:hypothetical protein
MPAGQLNLFPKDLIIQNAPQPQGCFSFTQSAGVKKNRVPVSTSTHLVNQFTA